VGRGSLARLRLPGSGALADRTQQRLTLAPINHRFTAYRDALGLSAGLDFHSLRRSYVAHLIEDGWDALFVQHQVGHEHASTTSIYTCVSSDYRTRTLRTALDATVTAALASAAPAAAPTPTPTTTTTATATATGTGTGSP
jgi:integrase